ncbi:Large ribosomal RNA subunit accumulation protein YceD [Thalassocella blandensis]|nr:Large ribosomal RNA subunit accumulation protein YceD [Thalassocella blandensis]
MSEGAPIKRLPKQVEPRKLAYNQVKFSGVVKTEDLPRLAKAAQFTGDVRVCLEFRVDEQGRRIVKGDIEGNAKLECQRCLQAMDEQLIQASVSVAIVWEEDEAKQLPRDIDPWIVGEDEADFYALVEEELLLNLPVAAYHDYVCIDEELLSHGSGEEQEVERKNPFSVLASMKNQTKRDK